MLTDIELAQVKAPLLSSKTLPPSAYITQESFNLELQEIFYKEWICVARHDQLPNVGDYRSVQVNDQPLIIVRQSNGTIAAMSSVCPHRAMLVVTDNGNASNFSCPYHLWKFGLDGHLISAPHMDDVENFPPPNCGLKTVKTELWGGFIFVNLDPDSAGLNQRLADLDVEVSEYNMTDLVIVKSVEFDCPWNWKVLVENFMEAYHHIGPHKESIQPTHHAKDSYVSGSVENGWSVLHMPEASNQVQTEDGLPHISGLNPTQKKEVLASVIMPTFCWINTPSLAFWYELKPVSFDAMRLTIHTLLPSAIANSPDGNDIASLLQAYIEQVHIEDIAVNKGPWEGLNAPLTEPGSLSLLEASIWQLNQWWVARIAE